VTAYRHHEADPHLGTSGSLETILHLANLTFLGHAEAPGTARHQLVQHTLTLLHPSHRRHLSGVGSVVVAGEAISNFAVAAAAGETSTIVTCSEGTAPHQFHDGRETHVRSLARLVNLNGGMKDASTDETKSVDPTGLTESVMPTAREESHHSLVSRTVRPTTH
jgi:hypothetical protein